MIEVLFAKVQVELDQAICPAPAIDTLIGFLLRYHRLADAQLLHAKHQNVMETTANGNNRSNSSNRTIDAISSLQERARLLELYASHGSYLPVVDAQMISNLQRGLVTTSTGESAFYSVLE